MANYLKSSNFIALLAGLAMSLVFLLNSCQKGYTEDEVEKIKKEAEQRTQRYDTLLAFVSLSTLTDEDFNRISQKLERFPVKEGENIIDTLLYNRQLILYLNLGKCCGSYYLAPKAPLPFGTTYYPLPDYVTRQLEKVRRPVRPCLSLVPCPDVDECKRCKDACQGRPAWELLQCLKKCEPLCPKK